MVIRYWSGDLVFICGGLFSHSYLQVTMAQKSAYFSIYMQSVIIQPSKEFLSNIAADSTRKCAFFCAMYLLNYM